MVCRGSLTYIIHAMKLINYFEVNPGGNTTAIVRGIFTTKRRKVIARRILSTNKKIEQVGFWMPASSKRAVARLEMAGGEFCGNATRSLATLLNKKGSFWLETSGLDELVRVQASSKSASVVLSIKTFRLKDNTCTLPGITHILKADRFNRQEAKRLLRSKALLQKRAAGVIGYKKLRSDLYEILPVVWVRDIATLIAETACASGTLALAYLLWQSDGITSIRIKQPSGAIFTVRIKGDSLMLKGPIRGISKKTLELRKMKDVL